MDYNLKKYTSILLKGTFASTIATSTTQVIGIILLPVFTYYLTPKDYGIVSIVSMIAIVLSHITNPGMLSATTRLYHDTDDINERRLLIGSAYWFFIFITLIPVVICLLFGPEIFSSIFNDFSFYPFGFLAVILTLIRQPARVWITLMNLQYKFHQATIYNGIAVIIGIAFSLVLVVGFGMGAMGKVLGMFPSALILLVISVITVQKYTSGIWSLQNMKKQFVFGLPILGALWSTQILELGGAYMLERLSNLTNVGLYALGMSLAQLPLVLIYGFRQMWNPVVYDNMNSKNYQTISKLICLFVGAITVVNLLILLFSKEAVLILVNERYFDAIPLVGFLIIGVYFNALISVSNSILGYKNRFGMISVFALIASVLFIILSLILIPKTGAIGAAISFGVSFFIFFVLGVWHQLRTITKIMKNFNIIIPIISMIFVTFATYFISQYFPQNELNILEISIKTLLFLISTFLLFHFKIFLKSDFIAAYNFAVKKLAEIRSSV